MASFLIVAGTSAVGREISKQLSDEGHKVFITGREESKTHEVANSLGIEYELLDAADFEAIHLLFKKVKSRMGKIDGVVNCPGSFLLKPAHLTSKEEYELTVKDNLTSAFAVTRAAGEQMQEGGSVVLISSAVGRIGIASHEAMAAAKAGVIGLMMSAAASYAHQNLRFNAVAPGLIYSHMSDVITHDPILLNASEKMHPLHRIGTPEEVTRVIIFLLREENSWITGQVFGIDGGISTIQPKINIKPEFNT